MLKAYNLDIKNFSFGSMPNIDDFMSSHIFKKGQTIFYKGHIPYGLFILLNGEVEIQYDNKKYQRVSGNVILGLSAFLKKTPNLTTIKAISNCNTLFLSNSVYNELKDDNHPVINWLNSL